MDITNRYYKHIWLIIALMCSGCATNLLNSERIEKKFGSYGLDIIDNSKFSRVSFLYSLDSNCQKNLSDDDTQKDLHCKQYRTLAIVNFFNFNDVIYEHKKILNGASIGATFKKNNWSIEKETILISEFSNKENQIINEWSNNSDLEKFAIHIYEISLKKSQLQVKYAQIIEIHNSSYLVSDDLIDIYGEPYQIDIDSITLSSYKASIHNQLEKNKVFTNIMDKLKKRKSDF